MDQESRVLRVWLKQGALYGTWEPKAGAKEYRIEIHGEKHSYIRSVPAEELTGNVLLCEREELTEGEGYTIEVFAVLHREMAEIQIPNRRERLNLLKERILSGQEGTRYILNAQILEEEELVRFLKSEYETEQIFVESRGLPQLDEGWDVLHLGLDGEARQVCFWIDDSGVMQMAVFDSFVEKTCLKDIYGPFDQTGLAYMRLRQAVFCRSTAEKNDGDPGIQKGKSLRGRFSYCLMQNGFQESCILSENIQADILLEGGVPVWEQETAVSRPIYLWLEGELVELSEPVMRIQCGLEHQEVSLQGTLNYRQKEIPAAIRLSFPEGESMQLFFSEAMDSDIFGNWPAWLFSWIDQGTSSQSAVISYQLAEPCEFRLKTQSNSQEVSLSEGIFLESWELQLSRFSFFQGMNAERGCRRELFLSGRVRSEEGGMVLLEADAAETALWHIRLRAEEGSGLLRSLAGFVGFDMGRVTAMLPEPLGLLEQMDLSEVVLFFDPEQRQICQANFTIIQNGIWTLIPSRVWMEEIQIQTCLKWQGDWQFQLEIKGVLVLQCGTKEIRLEAFLPVRENHTGLTLSVGSGEQAVLSLSDLFEVFQKEQETGILPRGFCEFGNPSLRNLTVNFELHPQMKLRFLHFQMATEEEWAWLPAGMFSLKSVKASLGVSFDETTTIQGQIQGIIALLQQDFTVFVKKTKSGWEGSGRLIGEWDLSLPELSGQAGIVIPEFLYQWGLPREIRVVDLQALVCSEEERIAFSFATEFDWKFGIGPIKFCFEKLFLDLIIERKQMQKMKGSAGFSFCGFSVLLEMEVQQHEETLRFLGKLEKNDLSDFSPAEMADAFVEDEGKKSEHLPIPDSFLFPIPDSAELFIDMGAEQYVMTGSFPGIGIGGFASVKNGEEADYVFAFALAESFHFSGITQTLGILDQMFQVENAGLLISTFDAESVESLFSRIACKLIPTELTQYQDAVKQGLFLYGTFRFSGMLERTFCMLTGMETSPKLSVAAALPKEESGTVIAADLDNLSLFGLIAFRDVRFLYTVKDGACYHLQGTASLALFGTEYFFSGSMAIRKTQADFRVETAQELRQPFGIPNLTLKKLKLAIHADFPEETETCYQIFFEGSVEMGAIELNGRLYYLDGSPQLFSLALGHQLDFNQLLQMVLTSALWPDNLLDLTLRTGEFYYAKQKTTLEENTYEAGMHLESRLCFYGLEFQISGHFSEDAVSVSGSMIKPISLGFASFTDCEFQGNGPGVRLEVSDSEKKLGLSCGVVLFGEKLAAIPFLGYDLKSKCFAGTIGYQGEVEALRGTISFTWDEENGFEIQEWPMRCVTDLLDYAELFKAASTMDSSGCGPLTDLIFEKAVETDFSVDPSFEGTDENGNLSISLLVSYTIRIAGQKVLTTSMPSLHLSVSMPERLGFSQLWNAIFSTITESAFQIAKDLLEHVDQLGKFLAVMGVVKGTQQVFDALVCRGIKQGISSFQQAEVAKEMASQAKEFAGKGGSGAIEGAAGAAADAGGAAAAASGGLETSEGFFAVLGSVFFFTVAGGSGKRAEEEKEKAEEGIRQAQEAEQEAREAVVSLLRIQELSARFLNGTRVAVQWKALEEKGIHYRLTAWQDGKELSVWETEASCFEVVTKAKEETEIRIQVQAVFSYEGKETYTYMGNSETVSLRWEALRIETRELPVARAGKAYYLELKACGGQAPYQWHAKGLPEGIALEGSVLMGMPTIGGGQVPVEIELIDAFGHRAEAFYWMKVEQE